MRGDGALDACRRQLPILIGIVQGDVECDPHLCMRFGPWRQTERRTESTVLRGRNEAGLMTRRQRSLPEPPRTCRAFLLPPSPAAVSGFTRLPKLGWGIPEDGL